MLSCVAIIICLSMLYRNSSAGSSAAFRLECCSTVQGGMQGLNRYANTWAGGNAQIVHALHGVRRARYSVCLSFTYSVHLGGLLDVEFKGNSLCFTSDVLVSANNVGDVAILFRVLKPTQP